MRTALVGLSTSTTIHAVYALLSPSPGGVAYFLVFALATGAAAVVWSVREDARADSGQEREHLGVRPVTISGGSL